MTNTFDVEIGADVATLTNEIRRHVWEPGDRRILGLPISAGGRPLTMVQLIVTREGDRLLAERQDGTSLGARSEIGRVTDEGRLA